MIAACFNAAEPLGRPDQRELAARSLERIVLLTYRPGAGVAHYFDGTARVAGLLCDQVHVAAALLDAHDASGNVVYEMLAEELMRYSLRVMWDERDGGFFDRAPEPPEAELGRLKDRLKPFGLNCHAARVLWRLAASSGEPEFRDRTCELLDALAPALDEQGVSGASYGLAILDTLTEDG
jgi:uncharacterized protein YyaL (SSP411 family)